MFSWLLVYFSLFAAIFFWLMAKVVGSNGSTAPLFLWVPVCCTTTLLVRLVDEATKYDGILAFIGDVFSNLCCNFRGFGTKEACFEQV